MRPPATVTAIRWSDTAVRAFVASHPHGTDYQEIADYLGVSKQAIHQACREAMRWAHAAWVLDEWRERRREA